MTETVVAPLIVIPSLPPHLQADKILETARRDPEYLREFILHVQLDKCQAEVFDSIMLDGEGFKRVAHVGANGIGKTYEEAAICLGFIFVYRPSKVIITSKTGRQAEKQTWDEVKRIEAESPFFQELRMRGYPFGDMQETQYRVYANDRKSFVPGHYMMHFAVAGGKSDSDIEAAFEGWHAPNLLLALDEAKRQHPAIWRGSERLFTAIEGVHRMLAVGSAGAKSAPFGQCFYGPGAKYWERFKTTMYDSPRVNHERADQLVDTWGKDHPLIKSMVFAEFTDQDSDSLISLADIEKCIRRNGEQPPKEGKEQAAIDWAREGDCETVFGVRKGEYVFPFRAWKKKKGTWSAGEVLRLAEEFPGCPIVSDETGLGGPIQDFVAEIQMERNGKIDIQGLLVGQPAKDTEHFANIRAEMFVQLARRFQKGEISIPNDPVLISQLSSIKYEFDSKGRMKIVSKEELAEEGYPSPDRADDLAMLFYEVDNKIITGGFAWV